MLSRCNNPNHANFPWYGARGIRVCERWSIYENFLADMGRRPSDAHSIDRIDVNGNYEPSNCRWAGNVVQNRNTRWNHTVTVNGETKCVTEWLESTGVNRRTFYRRVAGGMAEAEALTMPARPYIRKKPRHKS